MDFTGKRILVTGASRGIGRAAAAAFSAAGGRVAVHYRAEEAKAREVLAGLAGSGHVLLQADLEDPEAPPRLMRDAVEALGGLDVLVNNAGVWEGHPAESTSYDDWRAAWTRTLQINLISAAMLCHGAAAQMIEQGGGGRIVNVSSRGAFRGEPWSPAYGASKAGMNSMSQSLAQALAPHNIIVTVLAPGFVETDMAAVALHGPDGDAVRAQSPMNRAASPEEMARALLFLASDECDYMTGAILDVNGASYLRS